MLLCFDCSRYRYFRRSPLWPRHLGSFAAFHRAEWCLEIHHYHSQSLCHDKTHSWPRYLLFIKSSISNNRKYVAGSLSNHSNDLTSQPTVHIPTFLSPWFLISSFRQLWLWRMEMALANTVIRAYCLAILPFSFWIYLFKSSEISVNWIHFKSQHWIWTHPIQICKSINENHNKCCCMFLVCLSN